MKFVKFSLFCFAVFFVNSCANYTFDSNISVDNVKNMFKSQRVKKYTNSELYNYVYVDLGTVEGLSCQLTEDDLEQIRTKLKGNAPFETDESNLEALRKEVKSRNESVYSEWYNDYQKYPHKSILR